MSCLRSRLSDPSRQIWCFNSTGVPACVIKGDSDGDLVTAYAVGAPAAGHFVVPSGFSCSKKCKV